MNQTQVYLNPDLSTTVHEMLQLKAKIIPLEL